MQARLRRLQADFKQVEALFSGHPYIRLLKAEGSPPERYTFALTVQGLVPAGEDAFTPGGVECVSGGFSCFAAFPA